MDKNQFIVDALLKLKSVTLSIRTEEDLRMAMNKYDMLLLGNDFNTIYARELRHALEHVFKKEISLPDLLAVIPTVCDSLEMKYERMVVANSPDTGTADYQITLF
ncbi:MAG: hypothetical protein J7559_16850 [Cohnella sp.]|nr:hypothetical protein [Cohnella sp.]